VFFDPGKTVLFKTVMIQEIWRTMLHCDDKWPLPGNALISTHIEEEECHVPAKNTGTGEKSCTIFLLCMYL
jgi:hypothetical protein